MGSLLALGHRVELDLGGDQAVEVTTVDIDFRGEAVERHIEAALREPPALGRRPEGFELLWGDFDLLLQAVAAGASLHRQETLCTNSSHPNLRLGVGGEVTLLDLLRAATLEAIGSMRHQELPLDFRRQACSLARIGPEW